MDTASLTPETDDLLRQLLRQTLGPQVELVGYTVANQRPDYLVLLADLAHPSLRVSIKLAGPDAPYVYPFDRAASLHMLVRAHTSIPMPEVLAFDTGYRQWPWRYMIKTCIPGQKWASVRDHLSQDQLRAAYTSIGQAVGEMHTIQFPAFGELSADGQVRGGTDLIAALTRHAEARIQSPRLRDLWLGVLHEHAHLFTDVQEARLCHEDLHGYNILMSYHQDQWRLATILDFDKAWAGHHEADLARLDLWTSMTGDGFWATYESILHVAPLYKQRRPIYQLFWCLEYAVPTPAHLADTQQICRQLSLPPITDFM